MQWKDLLNGEKSSKYFQDILNFVAREREHGKVIYPPQAQVFNAFKLTPLNKLKIVILGQDPYHGAGQAMGLAFSVPKGVAVPPSLKNIYNTLQNDYPDFLPPQHGDLSAWAEQGVLLLNTVLTVEEGKANSHANLGWEIFTDKVISKLSENCENLVFLLWGANAQRKIKLIDGKKHLILTSVHPSPLSAHRGFFHCGHFKKTNQYLNQHQIQEIDWRLPLT